MKGDMFYYRPYTLQGMFVQEMATAVTDNTKSSGSTHAHTHTPTNTIPTTMILVSLKPSLIRHFYHRRGKKGLATHHTVLNFCATAGKSGGINVLVTQPSKLSESGII